eukprot:TRINITY_DN1330_c0_g1_i8.p1 TRINITY_DN1330_c0_g1~~TRINITY_DN1330_c0_g1_i8.p1  ORF type:complete len:1484 (+),score=294.48 TRINITY_DN1330_c0_g1_i8:69-4454(+)
MPSHAALLLLLAGLACTAAASDNRPVNVALHSTWAPTLLEAETAEYVAAHHPAHLWFFLTSLRIPDSATDRERASAALDLACQIVEEEPLLRPFLQYSLAQREFSPAVAMHHDIARTIRASTRPSCPPGQAFAVIAETGRTFCDPALLLDTIRTTVPTPGVPALNVSSVAHRHPRSSHRPAFNVVLLGPVGSASFAAFTAVVGFLVRDEAAVFFHHEQAVNPEQAPLMLQGYGVELALKNMEYKVIDDSKVEADAAKAPTPSKSTTSSQDELAQQLENLLSDASARSVDLKSSEIRNLGIQITQTVLASPDPIRKLRDINHNFPLFAPSFVRVPINDSVQAEIAHNQMWIGDGTKTGAWLFVNGISLHDDKLDALTLAKTIRQEKDLFRGFERSGLSAQQSRRVLQTVISVSTGAKRTVNMRFDLRGEGIMWLTNVENEQQFSRFPSISEAYRTPPIPGQIQWVRKNIFNILVVLSPFSQASRSITQALFNMIQRGAPVRFGIVWRIDAADTSVPAAVAESFIRAFSYLRFRHGSIFALAFVEDATAAFQNSGASFAQVSHIQDGVASLLSRARRFSGPQELQAALDAHPEVSPAHQAFAEKKGFTSSPLIFLNGVPLERSVFEQNLMNALLDEESRLRDLWAKKVISDKEDVLEAILKQPDTFPRINTLVVPDASASSQQLISFADPEATSVLDSLTWFHAAAARDSTKTVSIMVFADFSDPEGAELAAAALKFVDTATSARVALVSNHRNEEGMLTRALRAAYNSQLLHRFSTYAKLLLASATPHLASYETVVALATEAELKLSAFHTALERGQEGCDFCAALLKLPPGHKALVANGRIIPIPVGTRFTADDFRMLAQHESSGRPADFLSLVDSFEFAGDAASTPDFRSDVLLRLSTHVALHGTRSRMRIISHLRHTFSGLSIKGSSDFLEVSAIFNPLAKEAQRVLPFLLQLQTYWNASLTVYLNPPAEITEMPLNSFYRYNLHAHLDFDADGRLVEGPITTFSHLPQSRTLTLNLDVPESWLATLHRTAYDTDNIILANLNAEDAALNVAFHLENVVVTGSCFDFATRRNPTQGLALVLGSEGAPGIIQQDTVVMQNLGYFQLKANPGAYRISLRPGRSSRLYQLVNSAGDPLEYVSVNVDSFGGAFVELLVVKKPGTEHLSLLDQDDAVDTAQPSGIWNSISSMLSSPKAKEHTKETVHVFSLASGHLYERFLRIMMASVVKHTKHPVKFWILKNYLSPTFKNSIAAMAAHYNFSVELVTYKWPHFLRKQTEKQRIIWAFQFSFVVVSALSNRKISGTKSFSSMCCFHKMSPRSSTSTLTKLCVVTSPSSITWTCRALLWGSRRFAPLAARCLATSFGDKDSGKHTWVKSPTTSAPSTSWISTASGACLQATRSASTTNPSVAIQAVLQTSTKTCPTSSSFRCRSSRCRKSGCGVKHGAVMPPRPRLRQSTCATTQ